MRRSLGFALSVLVGLSAVGFHCARPAFASKRRASDHAQTSLPSDKNFERGMTRYNFQDYDGAIDAWLQCVYFARNNYQPVAFLWLGKAYMQKNEDPKAIEAFKKCIEQSLGGTPDAHLYMAEVLLRNKRLKEAEDECYTAMRETMGTNFRACNVLGKVYEAQDNWSAAQAQFQAALGEKPYTYTEAWKNLAEMHMKQQHWVNALQEFRAMLVNTKKLVDINYEEIYCDIGICLVAKGDHVGAMDSWHRTLDYNPKNPEAHLQLAMMYDSENHIQSAINEYKDFIRFSKDQQKVQKAKDRMTVIEHKLVPEMSNYQTGRPSDQVREQYERQDPQAKPRGDSGF